MHISSHDHTQQPTNPQNPSQTLHSSSRLPHNNKMNKMQALVVQTSKALKVILRLITQKCELERITTALYHRHTLTHMVQGVRRSLFRSTKLPQVKQTAVEQTDDFDPGHMVSIVASVKHFENQGLYAAFCSLRMTNLAISHLSQLAKTQYSDQDHSEMLNELWTSLKPDSPLDKSALRNSTCWSDIGFQGKDPITDLRGAGLLGLLNLHFFAHTSTQQARQILNELCQDITQGDFPFAITGINITAFLLSLSNHRLVDDLFLFPRRPVSKSTEETNETTPLLLNQDCDDASLDGANLSDDAVQQAALHRFNLAFSVLFTSFAHRWRVAAPGNVMAFPGIFDQFKQDVEQMIKQPQGIEALTRL